MPSMITANQHYIFPGISTSNARSHSHSLTASLCISYPASPRMKLYQLFGKINFFWCIKGTHSTVINCFLSYSINFIKGIS